MAAPEQVQQAIDVDQLAKDKVEEIECFLKSPDDHKLELVESWFTLLRQIITAADLHRTNDKQEKQESVQSKSETGDSIYAYYADDDERIHAADPSEQFASYSVKWTIRVRAFKLVHRIAGTLTQPSRTSQLKTPTTKHLPDLIRLSFVAATSPYDDLKLQGFEMFRFLVTRFANVEERQFPGHSILEQYKIQIISALRPAFELDSPPYITAIASRICSLWLCLGLEKDPIELQRIYDSMMTMTISKFENQSVNHNSKLYTESELEQERLDILCSWAQLYHVSCHTVTHSELDSKAPNSKRTDYKLLLRLVETQLPSLVDKWWEALRDYALLILPTPKIVGMTHDNEQVYTKDVALKLFTKVWSEILLAATLWLCSADGPTTDLTSLRQTQVLEEAGNDSVKMSRRSSLDKRKYFDFICGIVMKELCRYQASCNGELLETTSFALRSLMMLISNSETKTFLIENLRVAREFYSILYRIMSNHTRFRSQQYSNIKNLLDTIFKLIVIKINPKPRARVFGIAFFVESLKETIKSSQINLNTEEADTNAVYISVSIKICNILALVKSGQLDDTSNSPDLIQALIEVFQLALNFNPKSTFGVSILESMRELCQLLPGKVSTLAIDSFINSKNEILSKLTDDLLSESQIEKSHVQQIKSIYETLIRYIKHDIDSSSGDSRARLMNLIVETVLKICPKNLDELNYVKPHIQEITIINLKFLDTLSKEYRESFEDSVSSDTLAIYKSVLSAQEDRKARQNAKQVSRTINSTSRNATNKPAKIVLKADFSNFYGK